MFSHFRFSWLSVLDLGVGQCRLFSLRMAIRGSRSLDVGQVDHETYLGIRWD